MFKRKTTTSLAAAALAASLAALAVGPSARASTVPLSTCGKLVTTSVVLTQDLTCPGYGIIVAASGITIDLNGHALKGAGFNAGVDIASLDRVTIKNGVLRDFNVGVDTGNGADNIKISNVVLSGNTTEGAHITGDSASITSSTASGNGKSGVEIVGDSASITSSTFSANGEHGIHVNGASASIRSATSTGNAAVGIFTSGAHTSVNASRAVGNDTFGFVLQGDSASVTSSTAAGNTRSGIWITGDAASVRSMKASGNGDHGIVVIGDAATLTGNRSEANGFPGAVSDDYGVGIYVDNYSTAPVGKNVARANDGPVDCQPASLCPAPAAQTVKAGWTPITSCGQTVTTNAVLTQDLDCVGTGVVVGASGVTIDLQGHTLAGDRLHFGIFDENGYDNLTVKNGVVREFVIGVGAYKGADNVTLSNVVSVGNSNNGATIVGNSASIASSTMSGNGGYGTYVSGNGAAIKSTTFTSNGQNAINVNGDSASLISSTAAGNAAGVGMHGNGISVKSSSSVGNGWIGFYLAGDAISVMSSTVSGNALTGLTIVGNSAVLKSTKASGNGEHGIYVSGDAATLTGNRADGNGFPGGASDGFGLGIYAANFTTAPVGANVARGNDDGTDCQPASIC